MFAILAVVALSTLPIYLIIVIIVAPFINLSSEKELLLQLKPKAIIEVISGIQTVKAQNFELTARWKWQDRYRNFVTEGFKSVALGSTSGEIGSFLNQVSGLLILWVGMALILQGEFTLGQLVHSALLLAMSLTLYSS